MFLFENFKICYQIIIGYIHIYINLFIFQKIKKKKEEKNIK